MVKPRITPNDGAKPLVLDRGGFFAETQITLHTGESLEVLRSLPDRTFQMCVTSPPYYGLRSYLPDDHPRKHLEIGQEKTPEEFIEKLVKVFREVRRVLRDDGTCWINIGDSYANNTSGGVSNGKSSTIGVKRDGMPNNKAWKVIHGKKTVPPNVKQKDLLGIPWMLAFALRADGWYLRSDIIWSKPNPMPESVTDRPAKSHEYVFQLSKSARYFYDHTAIAEPATHAGKIIDFTGDQKANDADPVLMRTRPRGRVIVVAPTRNARTVWTIPSQGSDEAHFAMMPRALAERCILAGTSNAGQCPHCGIPWERVTTKGDPDLEWQRSAGGDARGEYHGVSTKYSKVTGLQNPSEVKARILAGMGKTHTIDWIPECKCPRHEPVPQHVLDPFGGAGTTGVVARDLGRHATLIELNETSTTIAVKRGKTRTSIKL